MFNARLIDFCFHICPEKTFGEMWKFSEVYFKIKDLLANGTEFNEVIGEVNGFPIILTSISAGKSITYKLELNGVVWVIHDNINAEPNQDFSKQILQYMAWHFNDKTLYDIFNLEHRVVKPKISDLYVLWIKLVDEFNKDSKGFKERNICVSQDKYIRVINARPATYPDEIIGKVDIIENGVFESFVFNTDGIPFKEGMKLRTTLIKQKGSFIPTPTLTTNKDFTQKDY